MPILGMPVSDPDQMDKAADVLVRFDNDMATSATIATVGTTARNVGLAPEAACTRTAVTRFTENADLIYEHDRIVAV